MQYRWAVGVVLVVSNALGGCSPALDWREFEPEDSGLVVTFPCRPDRHARTVTVAGATARMDMLVCAAAEATYALTFIDVAEPAGVAAALADLRAVAASNLGATAVAPGEARVRGMTPNPMAAGGVFHERPARLSGQRGRHASFRRGGRYLLRRPEAALVSATLWERRRHATICGFLGCCGVQPRTKLKRPA
jgi:hypothetical protein